MSRSGRHGDIWSSSEAMIASGFSGEGERVRHGGRALRTRLVFVGCGGPSVAAPPGACDGGGVRFVSPELTVVGCVRFMTARPDARIRAGGRGRVYFASLDLTVVGCTRFMAARPVTFFVLPKKVTKERRASEDAACGGSLRCSVRPAGGELARSRRCAPSHVLRTAPPETPGPTCAAQRLRWHKGQPRPLTLALSPCRGEGTEARRVLRRAHVAAVPSLAPGGGEGEGEGVAVAVAVDLALALPALEGAEQRRGERGLRASPVRATAGSEFATPAARHEQRKAVAQRPPLWARLLLVTFLGKTRKVTGRAAMKREQPTTVNSNDTTRTLSPRRASLRGSDARAAVAFALALPALEGAEQRRGERGFRASLVRATEGSEFATPAARTEQRKAVAQRPPSWARLSLVAFFGKTKKATGRAAMKREQPTKSSQAIWSALAAALRRDTRSQPARTRSFCSFPPPRPEAFLSGDPTCAESSVCW
jgi:hypothetical protein